MGEVAGAGETAHQRDLAQGQGAVAQQGLGPGQSTSQQVLMGRQAEALAEHPREMVFRQCTQAGQLAQADRVFQMQVDGLHQQSPLVRRQPAFQAQPFAGAHLAEQGVAEHFMGQAAGQQALGGFVPVEGDQLMEASCLAGIFQKGAFP